MNTISIKTSALIGPALDWAVVKCEGEDYIAESGVNGIGIEYEATNYSANWAQGGPIIERESIDIFTEKKSYPDSWLASVARYQNAKKLVGWRIHQYGPTPLIAAMRCYVASKLGDTVQIPKELIP